ncbi:LuxR C-terminal-related transcriptional regulator [Planktothricoides sp. SR001]|uniref:nSTAND1 domain-containing NTPase n=1 Tax=Planktothricoides sp. SR001 TaxID=1705388 RepID=UPI0006C83C54|nr:LuxR C-terminal-related transcriptional regulator [Planktothricoides sp. SR001]
MDTQEFEEKYAQLTPKLHEVLTQVLQGIPDEEIAENMGIQPPTVRKHIERIYRVLDLNSDFPKDRRSRRSDLFTLFAQHKPEMLLTTPPFFRGAGGDLASNVTEANSTPPFFRGAGGDLASNVTEANSTPPLKRGAGGDPAFNVTEANSTPPLKRGAGGDPAPNVTKADKTDFPPHPRNPFIPLTGRVDDPKLFFNREKEIRDIFELLNSGSHVSVVGEKGIGKSSVLQAICREAKSQLLQPREGIYLDLQSLENEDEFYMDLCDRLEITENRGIGLKRELKNKKLLLVMDKVEKLTEDGFIEGKIAGELRGLAEGMNAPLRLVFGSSQPLDELYQDKEKLSPFENFFNLVNLEPWDETTARAFIAQRLASTPVSFSDEEISKIITETKGHPQQLMQRCHKTYADYLAKNNGH